MSHPLPTRVQRRVSRILTGIHQRPRLVLGLMLAVVATCSVLLSRLTIDNSLEIWFVKNDRALLEYQSFLDDFGNDEWVVTTLTQSGAGLSVERLDMLQRVQNEIARVDGVERVRTLANFPVTEGEVLSGAPLVQGKVDKDDLARARQAIGEAGLARRFVGKSPDTLVLYTWLAARDDIDQERPRILDDIRAAVALHTADTPEQISHVGMGLMYDEINRSTLGEGAMFIGLSYLVIAAMMLFLFRSWRWTALALAVVTLADLVLFGAMVFLNRPLHMFTMALPSVVMVIAVAHLMHIHAHLGNLRGAPRQILTSIAAVAIPCILNGVTTSLGFSSLLSSQIAITRDFGLFAAIGVIAGLIFAFVGAALVLPRLPAKTHRARPDRMTNWLGKWVSFALRHQKSVFAITLLVIVMAGLGASRIVADTFALGFLADDHPLRRDSVLVEEQSGPYLPLEIILEVKNPGQWRQTDILNGLAEAQQELDAHEQLGSSYSIADVLGEAMRTLQNNPRLPARLVDARPELAAQLLELARFGEGQSDIQWLVSGDDLRLRMTVTVPMSTAMGFRQSGELAMGIMRAHLPAEVELSFGGYLPLNWTMVARLVKDQMRSFVLAFLLVFVVVALALRSLRMVIAAAIANLIPVLLTFGVMGAFGIRLDVATVTIAAAVLGIVVDDTIHLLWALRRALSSHEDVEKAIRAAISTSGAAIARTTLVFTVGFCVIACSAVHSVAAVGGLTAVAVAAAFVTDVCLLPVLVVWMYRKNTHRPRGKACEGRVRHTSTERRNDVTKAA